MEGSAVAPPRQIKSQSYLVVTILLGIAGSVVAVAAFGKGSYRVGPMLVEMAARPSTSGMTELAVEPFAGATGLKVGRAEAQTHTGFIALRGTVVGVVGAEDASLPAAILASKDPLTLATTIRDQGKEAMRKFGLRIGLLVLAGGGAGGFVIALVGLKTRRIFQGALAGVVVTGVLGLLAWQTYDIEKFSQVTFRPAGQAQVLNR